MTQEQAYREAKKRWGKNAFVRKYPSMSSPAQREVARRELAAARAEQEAIEKELTERLAACEWYQELTRRKREARKRIDAATGEALYEQCAVGKADSMFAHVLGSGDTFKEAFAKATE